MNYSNDFAYITGIAIGDGNISNPNGRTYRLRITCDIKYKNIINQVQKCLTKVFPKNKISLVKKKNNAVDISVYNKEINNMFGWKLEKGKKIDQKILIPKWIKEDSEYLKYFIKGLFESDGSIYMDRKYIMVNFVSYNKELVVFLNRYIKKFNFQSNTYKIVENNKIKYTLRVSKDTKKFINYFNINKS